MATSSSKNKKYFAAVGRRREASARVRLFLAKGAILVNDKPIAEYFPSLVEQAVYERPFRLTDTWGKYYATIKVVGSGKVGQLGAVVHGLARALDKGNPAFHTLLKKAGLLTRDPRTRERRKAGTGGKARRAKQSPKR
ncbi:MAG: 30S ribosomal protein S9 [Candidatus Shapirobacteria bacterium]